MWGALASLLGSVFNSIFGTSYSNKQSQKQMEFQAGEANINRMFAHDEAQIDRDFQQSMFDATNQYNSPKSVMNRLSDAGINPALAYSGGQLGTASMQGGSTASAPSTPNGSMASFYPLDPLSASQARLLDAQARNVDADTEKTQKETDWVDILNQNILDSSGVESDYKRALTSLTESQKQELNAKINEIASNVDLNNTLKSLYESQLTSQDLHNLLDARTFDANVKSIQSQANISETEAKLAYGLGLSVINLNNANAKYSIAQADTQKEIARLTGYQADVASIPALEANETASFLNTPMGKIVLGRYVESAYYSKDYSAQSDSSVNKGIANSKMMQFLSALGKAFNGFSFSQIKL